MLLSLGVAAAAMAQDNTPIYQNTNYSFEERAVDLVSRLTLEEKESLLGNNMAPVPRLGPSVQCMERGFARSSFGSQSVCRSSGTYILS